MSPSASSTRASKGNNRRQRVPAMACRCARHQSPKAATRLGMAPGARVSRFGQRARRSRLAAAYRLGNVGRSDPAHRPMKRRVLLASSSSWRRTKAFRRRQHAISRSRRRRRRRQCAVSSAESIGCHLDDDDRKPRRRSQRAPPHLWEKWPSSILRQLASPRRARSRAHGSSKPASSSWKLLLA